MLYELFAALNLSHFLRKVAASVNRPTHKFVPFSATLPIGDGIAINPTPKISRVCCDPDAMRFHCN